MGFQDMRLFNQALLSRQAWRLIQFPDSLCAQLLKAKYYQRGTVDMVFPEDASYGKLGRVLRYRYGEIDGFLTHR
jgi:hypothetical protein